MPSWSAVDLRMTPDQERLREELHDWLVKNLPWEYGVGLPPRSSDLEAEVAFGRSWQARLAADRWVGITWPVEVGGRGLGPTEHFVVTEELARARAPELVGRIGINLVAPTLFTHGTDDQRLRWLPPILGADQLWCQLFSEPDAGSDLASLSTRADLVDGGWVVTGRKVWTSYAQFADWGLCLARSHPDAPNDSRGCRAWWSTCMRPESMCGLSCRSPARPSSTRSSWTRCSSPMSQSSESRARDWTVANSTLSHERGVNPRQLGIHCQLLLGLLELARESDHGFADRDMRQRLAEAYIEVQDCSSSQLADPDPARTR